VRIEESNGTVICDLCGKKAVNIKNGVWDGMYNTIETTEMYSDSPCSSGHVSNRDVCEGCMGKIEKFIGKMND